MVHSLELWPKNICYEVEIKDLMCVEDPFSQTSHKW